jgi:hypothetical protein
LDELKFWLKRVADNFLYSIFGWVYGIEKARPEKNSWSYSKQLAPIKHSKSRSLDGRTIKTKEER